MLYEVITIGIELDRPCGDLVGRARDAGLLINVTAERVADKPLNEQFSDRIWSKMGMEHDGYFV